MPSHLPLHQVRSRPSTPHSKPPYTSQKNTTTIHHPPHPPTTFPTPSNHLLASDLSTLNLRCYDPGYTNTALATSRITYIDGNNGVLRYRGYPISQLAQSSNYLETALLLFTGELPSREMLRKFEGDVFGWGGEVGVGVRKVVEGFGGKGMPMGMMMGGVSCFGSEFGYLNPGVNQGWDDKEGRGRWECFVRLIGGLPVVACEVYWGFVGGKRGEEEWGGFEKGVGYGERFLRMVGLDHGMGGRLGRVLEVLLILHADHELNCSTATMRGLASSGVDVWSCVVGSIGALYGPLHGGATEAVVGMLERVGRMENVEGFLEGVKKGEERLMGFGHRVYRSYDPRAKIIGKMAHQVFEIMGKKDPLIEVAVALEKAALSDEYFVKRKLYPNVDFYSGLIYKAMGFPKEFFPVLFAMGRIAGWMSHWNEFLDDPEKRIARPRQNYVGYGKRDFVPMEERNGKSCIRAKL